MEQQPGTLYTLAHKEGDTMNMRSIVQLEIAKDERSYILSVPAGAPFGEVYDVLIQMSQGILDLAKQASQDLASKAPKEEASE
jgi:uncharacterized protein YrzB (UPF0473 family)